MVRFPIPCRKLTDGPKIWIRSYPGLGGCETGAISCRTDRYFRSMGRQCSIADAKAVAFSKRVVRRGGSGSSSDQ